MAIVISPYGGATLIGKIGSTVFQRGPFGNVARTLALPVNPNTTRQVAVRIAMEQSADIWKNTLSGAQRTDWAQYAKTTPISTGGGQPKKLTGRQMFLRSNILRFLFDGTSFSASPPTPGVAAVPTIAASGSVAAGVNLDVVTPGIAVAAILQLRVSPPNNFSRSYFSSPFTTTTFATDTDVLPLNLIPPGGVAIGQRYFIRYRYQTVNGKTSVDEQAVVDITS